VQPRAVLEAALYVDDLETAEAFYGGVLGLEFLSRMEGRHAFFRCGQVIVLLFNAEATRVPSVNITLPVPVHGASGAGHLCFRAEGPEIDAWKVKLEAVGVAIEADFEWPNGGRSIYFRDPSGNSLEFGEPKIWGWM
jgi:catechol 2,3-dioxygenase-like lactoylglutathione lyase family enzyme